MRVRKSGVALRLPPHSKFVQGMTWQLAKCRIILKYCETSEIIMDCAGKAKRRRRFRMTGDIRRVIRVRKSGVALRSATAIQIRPRYDMAVGTIPGLTWERGFFGVKIGFAFKLILFG
jgi:hypothetical protein